MNKIIGVAEQILNLTLNQVSNLKVASEGVWIK